MPEIITRGEDNQRSTKEALFSPDKIEGRTELNHKQIENVNKLKTLSSLFGNSLLDNHLSDFMILQQSKDRRSRSEYVESQKSFNTEALKKSTKSMHLLG